MKRHVNITLKIGGLEYVNIHSSLAAAAAAEFEASTESRFHFRQNGVVVELILAPVDPLPEYPE